MSGVKDINSLDAKIKSLEIEENIKIQALKGQRDSIKEQLSPANLLKSTVNNLSIKPGKSTTSALDIITGLVVGFIGKKFWAGKSAGWFRKLTAPIVQYFLTIFVKKKITKLRAPK